jgi:quercetin dioxygenase-like cupin family protein
MRRVFFLVAVLCLAAFTAKAQDPAKVDPQHCKVEFENSQVRVLHWHNGPHEKIPMHEHPAYVQISLTGGHGRFTLPDGTTKEDEGKAGQTSWNEPQKHSYEDLSGSATETIQLELKGKPVATQPAIQSALDPVKLDPKHNKVEFENAQVRVLRFTYDPHWKSPMHEHPANIKVYLTDFHTRFSYPDGKTEERQGKAGQVFWSAPVKHEAEHLGDKPLEGIQIELKAPRPAASKAPAAKKES